MSGAVFDLGCTVAERAICMTSWVSFTDTGDLQNPVYTVNHIAIARYSIRA
jgi:hypothetical protein